MSEGVRAALLLQIASPGSFPDPLFAAQTRADIRPAIPSVLALQRGGFTSGPCQSSRVTSRETHFRAQMAMKIELAEITRILHPGADPNGAFGETRRRPRASRKCDFYERPSLRRNYVGLVRWFLSTCWCLNLSPSPLIRPLASPKTRSGLVIRTLQARRGVSEGAAWEEAGTCQELRLSRHLLERTEGCARI